MNNCINCNCKSPIFEFLTNKELEIINKNRFTLNFNEGELIIKQGMPCTHVISFVGGLAKMYIEGKNGKNAILKIITPSQFISGTGLFVDNRHHFSVTALEPSAACFIKVDIMKEILSNNKKFAQEFMGELNKHQKLTNEKIINNIEHHSEGKLASTLLYLSNEIYKSNPYKLTLSKQEISEFAGISKENVFKIFKDFCDEGIIKNGGNIIEIVKFETLKEISEKG